MGHVHGIARPPRALTAGVSLSLSILFVVVYGATGWLTSLRANVGTWSFAWERSLPFVPWLVVPYISLDLLFVVAPFLCADRAELQVFRKRMTAAILAAGAMFVAMPLQFAYPRPHVAGWTAPLFGALHAFDRPYNLFPSLHIAILLILAGTYDRHTHGLLRWSVRVWFGLVGLSTVLIGQHHVIDVAGGAALALCCCYAIADERRTPQPVTRNPRIGTYYAGGVVLLAVVGSRLGPWGLPLLWPAVSMTIVAGAYFGLYAGVGRKVDGRLPLSARLVLAPWLAVQHLSLLHYCRQAAAWNEVAPRLWMGRQLRGLDADIAVKQGVSAVLDLTGEFSEARSFRSLAYLNLPVLDLTAPTAGQVRAALDFINAQRTRGVVYVHCKIGYSRSAAVVGCWLLDAGIARTPEEAVAVMRRVRPTLVVRSEAYAALCGFSTSERATSAPQPGQLIEART